MIVTLSSAEIRLAEKQAALAELGGESQVRSAEDRSDTLKVDQLIGQLGTIALHRYWFGNLDRYLLGRYYQNLNPWQGDRGEDIPAANVDVKTSVMRRQQEPLTYRLCVRPKERHPDWVYVLALVSPDVRSDRHVHLVGWAVEQELPATVVPEGPLAGAYVLNATDLHPLPPINYHLL